MKALLDIQKPRLAALVVALVAAATFASAASAEDFGNGATASLPTQGAVQLWARTRSSCDVIVSAPNWVTSPGGGYVYHRVVVAYLSNGQWAYSFGAWRSAYVSGAGVVQPTPWSSAPYPGVRRGTYWVGLQLYWQNLNINAYRWVGQYTC